MAGRLLRRRTAAAVVAYAVVTSTLLALSGCADEEKASYLRTETGRLVVDRPSAWATPFEVEAPWTSGYRAAPDSVEQIQLSGDFGEFVTASEAVGTLIGKAQVSLRDFKVVQSRDLTVKGATTGRATQYTFTANGGSQLTGEWIVAAHWPYPQSVAVSILTPTFDPDLERRVIDSLEMHAVES